MADKKTVSEYLMDNSLAEEALDCRRHGYVLTGKFLGQGAYANVYLGHAAPEKIQTNYKLRRSMGDQKELKVAIKIISTATAPEIYVTKFLPREVATMNKCYHHNNVIQLYDIFATHKRIYLVLEYAECGDLLTYVNHCYSRKSHSTRLTEDKARMMFRDILAGVQFVHHRGVAHRDLKCENILLSKNNRAKLSDFGFAIEPRHNRELLKTHCGSYAYAPPEILRQQKYDGKMADLWSLGVILFAMVNGGLPFKESGAKAVLSAMKKPVYFKGYLSQECRDLIRGLLRIKPHKRLSVSEIFAHSWMKKHSSFGRDDKNAFGDIPVQEVSMEPYPGSTLQDLYALGRAGDGFDKPENVLRYIKKCMGSSAVSKHSSGKHSSKSSRVERPKLPSKPYFLQNILNAEAPGDPPNFVLPTPPEKGQVSVATTFKPKTHVSQTKRTVRAPATPDSLINKVRIENRSKDFDRTEADVINNSAKTTLPHVKESREKISLTPCIKPPYKLDRKSGANQQLETPRGLTRIRGDDRMNDKGRKLNDGGSAPSKKANSSSSTARSHKTADSTRSDSKSSSAAKVINIKIKPKNVLHINSKLHGGAKDSTFSKYSRRQWRVKNTSSSAFTRKNHARSGGALSVPPPAKHRDGTHIVKGSCHGPWPEKRKGCQTVKCNIACSLALHPNSSTSKRSDLSDLPSKAKHSPDRTNRKMPQMRYNSPPKSGQHVSTSLEPEPARQAATPQKQLHVTPTRDFYLQDVSYFTSQAWSGASPASTALISYQTNLSKYLSPAAPHKPDSQKEGGGLGKLLTRRAQATRNVLKFAPVKGDNYSLARNLPGPSTGTGKDGRIVLKMRNKR